MGIEDRIGVEMLDKIKPYIAPRYWFTALGAILIVLGLTGGTEVAGVDLVIEGDVFRYIAIALGVVSIVGGLRLYKKFMKNANTD